MLSAAHTWSLTAIAALTGLALLWVSKRFSSSARTSICRRRMRAQLYAMRLYAADPALVLHAQAQLLLWTGRYLWAMLPPIAVAILPMAFLFSQLDNVYGHRALADGEATTVTARFSGPAAPDATLEGRGVLVETPGVRLPGGREVCWRVRNQSGEPRRIILHAGAVEVSRSIHCGGGFSVPFHFWRSAASLEVSCPAANLNVLGFAVAWLPWFLLVALLTMLVCRRF